MKLVTLLLSWTVLISFHGSGAGNVSIDANGYIAYCPCMGRFGNQADHFLGALSFAHGLNRTLILPPWIEYPRHVMGSIQIPFDDYFKVEPLLEYHRVITMETFMEELAPTLWPVGKRTGFCYRFRNGNDCKMKEGNPFGPFWDNFNIDFDAYHEFGPLSYNTHMHGVKESWEQRFPVSENPVVALSGAPAAFPVSQENRDLHRYLHWSADIEGEADRFIKQHLSNDPYVGIHIRHGSDWTKACQHVGSSKQLFASPQCLGYHNEFGQLTQDLCMPPFDLVKRQVKEVVKRIRAKAVFVAADVEPNIKELQNFLTSKVKVVQRKPAEPHIDLAILGKSDHYISNCISSFSAFAKRQRDAAGRPSSFWAFGKDYEKIKAAKHTDEL